MIGVIKGILGVLIMAHMVMANQAVQQCHLSEGYVDCLG